MNEFEKKYYVDRKNSGSIKWDYGHKLHPYDDLLPLSIADMDFRLDEKIVEKIKATMSVGIYGYNELPSDYFEVLDAWYQRHFNLEVTQDMVMFAYGAMDGQYQLFNSFFSRGDAVLNICPAYPRFKDVINSTGMSLYDSHLIYQDNYFYFDFKDIEDKINKHNIKAIILCSPHNPSGRIWRYDELATLIKICQKYHVYIISDEVHINIHNQDIKTIPTLKVAKDLNAQDLIITIHSAAKPFNLSGLNHAHIITTNQDIIKHLKQYQLSHGYIKYHIFSILPSYYVYIYGDNWLKELNQEIASNYQLFKDEMGDLLEYLPFEGTYFIFANFKKYLKDDQNAEDFLLEKGHIFCNGGNHYGDEYKEWARINLATSSDNIRELTKRLRKILL